MDGTVPGEAEGWCLRNMGLNGVDELWTRSRARVGPCFVVFAKVFANFKEPSYTTDCYTLGIESGPEVGMSEKVG